MDVKALLFSTLGQWVIALVVVGALALLSRLAVRGAALLAEHTAKAVTEHKSAIQMMMLRAGSMLATCAADAVAHIEATLRPQILGAAKDGKLDAAQAKLLRDEAIKLALEQAQKVFGAALMQIGVQGTDAIAPTIEHLVDIAAEKIAGGSRNTGVAGSSVPEAPKPEMKTTDLSGQPVP